MLGQRHYAILYKITSQCNDWCDFCLEYKFIKERRPSLSLEELKENYFYLKKKYKFIDYVILTGGEPTLHPQFFEMLDFFKNRGIGFRFLTNLLKFNEKKFLNNLKKSFTNFKNKKQQKLTKIISSVNDLPSVSQKAELRIAGLKKALKMDFPLMVTVVIYRKNLKDLPKLAIYLKNLFQKYAPGKTLHVEFRMIYSEGVYPNLLKKSLIKNFIDLRKTVEEVVNLLDTPTTKVTLWNFPLCYLSNFRRAKNEAVKERMERQLIKVNKEAQFDKTEIRDWEDYLKPHPECLKCSLRNFCSGVDGEYIKKHHYPSLRPK